MNEMPLYYSHFLTWNQFKSLYKPDLTRITETYPSHSSIHATLKLLSKIYGAPVVKLPKVAFTDRKQPLTAYHTGLLYLLFLAPSGYTEDYISLIVPHFMEKDMGFDRIDYLTDLEYLKLLSLSKFTEYEKEGLGYGLSDFTEGPNCLLTPGKPL
jgi:hypothetical protein